MKEKDSSTLNVCSASIHVLCYWHVLSEPYKVIAAAVF